MAADRLEIVRRTADYWNRHAWTEMEAVLEPDVTGRVVVEYLWTTRGKDSGIPFETPMWTVFTFRESRIARIEYFMEESPALEAARAPQ